MDREPFPTVAVLGAGAVGCYFGGMLARAGLPVTLIGRRPHVEAITQNGLFVESLHFRESLPIAATTDVEAVRDARVVLVCVKTPDTAEAAMALAPRLANGTVVVSMQNGVDNAERMAEAAGIDAVPAVVYVAAEMTAPGRVRHSGRGDLIVGNLSDSAPRGRLDDLVALFGRAGVSCRVSENVRADLWTKLIANCAYNAISALGRSRYGRIASNPWTRDAMREVIAEALAVARAAGVRLDPDEPAAIVWGLATTMAGATSSTAQDVARGKLTEIDALNGYVAKRGAELGVPAPVNRTLHALVKLLEESASEG